MTIVYLKDDWENNLNFAIKEYEKVNNMKPFIYANPKFKETCECEWHFINSEDYNSEDYDSSVGLYKGYNIEFLDNIDEGQIYIGRKLKIYDDEEKIANI